MSDYTIEEIKSIEARIGEDLTNAATLLILGVEAKFYRVTGDKTAVAWVKRVTDGSGFTFSRKSIAGELCARDAMIIELIKSGATMPEIAEALNVGIGTVHRAKTAAGVTPAGGSKRGAGKTSEPTEPTEPNTEDTDDSKPRKQANPIATALNAIDRVATDNKDNTEALAAGWKSIMLHLMEVSGLSAEELATLATA